MEASFKSNNQVSKAEQYDIFLQQFASLIEGETHEVSVLANTCAALKEAFEFFWVGFYLVENDELVLGPFQGSVACYRIKKGRGVCGTAWAERRTLVVPCGTAWAERRTLVVPDVDQFPGHIACSSLSRSEIVVPIIVGDEVKSVLDIDSDHLNTFDETDRKYLEEIVTILTQKLYQK